MSKISLIWKPNKDNFKIWIRVSHEECLPYYKARCCKNLWCFAWVKATRGQHSLPPPIAATGLMAVIRPVHSSAQDYIDPIHSNKNDFPTSCRRSKQHPWTLNTTALLGSSAIRKDTLKLWNTILVLRTK